MDAMYIRTTRFQAKRSSLPRFQELAAAAKGNAATLDGLQQSYLAIDDAGKGVMVAIWESKEKAAAGLPSVMASWAGAIEHMEGHPQMDEYSTVVQVKG
jgi:heme-degrading monooxygenase HmoA